MWPRAKIPECLPQPPPREGHRHLRRQKCVEVSPSCSSLLQPQSLSKSQALAFSPLFGCFFVVVVRGPNSQGRVLPLQTLPSQRYVYVIIPKLTTPENFEECY